MTHKFPYSFQLTAYFCIYFHIPAYYLFIFFQFNFFFADAASHQPTQFCKSSSVARRVSLNSSALHFICFLLLVYRRLLRDRWKIKNKIIKKKLINWIWNSGFGDRQLNKWEQSTNLWIFSLFLKYWVDYQLNSYFFSYLS